MRNKAVIMMSTDSLFSAFLTQNKDCRYGTGQRRRQYTEIRLMRHHPVLPEMVRCEDDDIGRCRMKWNGLHLGRWLGFMSQQILLKPSITVLPSIVPSYLCDIRRRGSCWATEGAGAAGEGRSLRRCWSCSAWRRGGPAWP